MKRYFILSSLMVILLAMSLFFGCQPQVTEDNTDSKADIALTLNTWTTGSLTTTNTAQWYYFPATSGTTYTITWDDSYQGSGAYTLDVKVTAYRANKTTTYTNFTNIDSAYTTPKTLTALATENVWLKVIPYTSGNTGTFAIKASGTTSQVANPTFSPAAGTYTSAQTITLATTTSGASIRYTVNGTTPSSTTGTLYSAPFSVSATTTVKAIAYKSGMSDSSVVTATYTINTSTETLLANDTWVTGTAAANSPLWYYFNATSGQKYDINWNDKYQGDGTKTGDIQVTAYRENKTTAYFTNIDSGFTTAQVVTAAATEKVYLKVEPYNNSATYNGTFAIKGKAQVVLTPVATPTFTPAAGTYTTEQTVTIATTTTGATIRYTIDGTTPSQTNGTTYSAGILVNSTKTIKAMAYKSGMADSSVASATYTINLPQVATPTFSPAAGTYTTAQTVTLATTTSGATIRYTTDGSTPSQTVGTVYSGTINVASSTTIKAIAYKSGMSDSTVASATYTISGTSSGEWVFMIYLDADNNLEPYAIKDFNEMEYGLYQLQQSNPTLASKIKIVVLIDRITGYDTTNGNWTDTRAFEVVADSNSSETGTIVSTRIAIPTLNITATSTTVEINMGDPNNLNKFIAFGKSNYSNYAKQLLVLWNHGGGVKAETGRAACWDDSNGGDCLYLDEIKQAIAANYTSADKLEAFGFDACLMGMVEVAYQYKDLVKYMSISPNTEGGDGWDYELIVKRMVTGMTGADLTTVIVQAYRDSTASIASETQTAVDLAYIATLKTKVDALAVALYAENKKTSIETTITSSTDYSQGDYNSYPFYEAGKFCKDITTSTTYSTALKTAAQDVINALSNAVIYAYGNSGMGNYYGTGASVQKGLALFFPVNKSTKASTYSSNGKWYTSANMSATSTPYGNINFCTYNNNGTVETWKELLEKWYDSGNTITADTY